MVALAIVGGCDASEQPDGTSVDTIAFAELVVDALAVSDFAALAELASRSAGVRFSPYPLVDVTTDVVLTADQIGQADKDSIIVWGTYDGSGAPIELSIADYFALFVYDYEFKDAPSVKMNAVSVVGTIPNNIKTTYGRSKFVEFHFDSVSDSYEDWRSLWIVVDESSGTPRLIGVVHGQRTI